MPVRLTAKELAALKIAAAQMTTRPAGPPPVRARRRPPEEYRSECYDCREVFTVRAAEDRHLDATRHCRYQITFQFVDGDGAEGALGPVPIRLRRDTQGAYASTMNTPDDPDVPAEPDTPGDE